MRQHTKKMHCKTIRTGEYEHLQDMDSPPSSACDSSREGVGAGEGRCSSAQKNVLQGCPCGGIRIYARHPDDLGEITDRVPCSAIETRHGIHPGRDKRSPDTASLGPLSCLDKIPVVRNPVSKLG